MITDHWLLAGATLPSEVMQLYYWRINALEATLQQLSEHQGPHALVILGRHQSYAASGPGRVMYDRLVDASQRANAAVYFLDCQGAQVEKIDAPLSTTVGGPLDSRGTQREPPPFHSTVPLLAGRRPNGLLEAVAADTGGFAAPLGDDFAAMLARILGEVKGDYIIGFEPSLQEGRLKYHALKVKVRRDGCRVKTRTGYFASPAQPPGKP